MTHDEIVHLQHELNRWAKDHKELGRQTLIVDGGLGKLTLELLHAVRWDLGYTKTTGFPVDDNFFKRLHHPTEVHDDWGQTKTAVKVGKDRRRKRRVWVVRNRIASVLKPGVGTFDGVSVAKAAIPILKWCRENGWKGRLVSGYRTPAYSESLCYAMCGRPSCPGRCAGRSTNHAYAVPERFAMDVSDYVNFGHIVAKCPLKPHVHNALPNDLVHFSPSGN
jgi:hypothetical protein